MSNEARRLMLWRLAVLAAACSMAGPAASQGAPQNSLRDQILAQYKLAKFGTSGAGLSVLDYGAILTVQKTGIFVIPPANLGQCGESYKDGELKPGGGFCRAMFKNTSRYLEVGEKVLLAKLDVNLKDEKVSLLIAACEACSSNQPSTFYKGEVTFQFPKGYLESADAGQVEDVISQVFALPSASNDAQGQQQDRGQSAAPEPAAAPPPPAAAPPAEPPTVQIGQTIEQVKAIMGPPDKIVNLGAKQIYIYKDLKVTFVNGKVSDAQ